MYPHQMEEQNKGHHRTSALKDAARRYKWVIAGSCVVLVIILSVVLGVSVGGGGGGGGSSNQASVGSGSDTTGTSQSGDPLSRKKADLKGRITSSFDVLGLPATHTEMFNNPESPQARALNWVASSEKYDDYDGDQRLQRYALAAFFYATYAVRNAYVTQQVPWTTAEKWLGEEHECEWEGITCDPSATTGNRVVTSIELEEHRISGEIPLDIVLMRETLRSLILSNNLIFMEGDALEVFSYLENLEVLMMADNYIVERNGLPESLRNLKKLKKIILSYNLLQGAIRPGYFTNLGKLTHLEIESNYLSGPLPSSIYEMEQLVYLYIRRNDFHFNFHHALATANWPNMCKYLHLWLGKIRLQILLCLTLFTFKVSMWLDHNNITGTFPTEVGKLTGLASFSVTNTTVRGTIPSEIGRLTGLRRLWLYGNLLHGEIPAELGNLPALEVVELYGNKLEGTMPQGTCDAVKAASYEYKVLSADCEKVQCANCCTQCY
jgi:hypothetical protein